MKKFKLPKFFMVFGLKIEVVVEPIVGDFAGLYEPWKAKITIDSSHPSQEDLLHTLIHELGHAVFYRVSINQSVSREVHEYIVNNMATMLIENFDIKPKVKK